jgi:hypothetical protein
MLLTTFFIVYILLESALIAVDHIGLILHVIQAKVCRSEQT